MRAIGRAADARYIVLTRVVGADTPQVVTHLVETRTSVIHWSARALLTPGDGARELADRADGVAGELGGLHGPIVRLERQRLRTAEGDSLDAHDCYLRAADGIDCDDRESALAALGFARRCTDLDPQFARGWMMLGWRRNQVYSYRWDAPGPGWLAEEQTIFRRAVDLAPRDPVALGFLALSRAKLGAAAEAQRLARHAADVGAADPEAATELSLMLSTIAGEPARALAMIDRAFDRSSDPPARWGFMATRAAFFAGAFVRALATSDAAPDCLPKLVYRSLSAAELGDLAETRASMKRLFARVPHFSFDWYARNQGISHPAARDRYRSAAAKVGAAAAH